MNQGPEGIIRKNVIGFLGQNKLDTAPAFFGSDAYQLALGLETFDFLRRRTPGRGM